MHDRWGEFTEQDEETAPGMREGTCFKEASRWKSSLGNDEVWPSCSPSQLAPEHNRGRAEMQESPEARVNSLHADLANTHFWSSGSGPEEVGVGRWRSGQSSGSPNSQAASFMMACVCLQDIQGLMEIVLHPQIL